MGKRKYTRKYTLNEDYFELINSHEKAYILGFIYADGYVSLDRGNLTIVQDAERVDILNFILKELNSNKPLTKDIQRVNGKLRWKLIANSRKLADDLKAAGCDQNKTFKIRFPKFIDDKFMGSFILGYFDGDGCIWNGKRKKMIVKDPRNKKGWRERIVHNVKFTFTGCTEFISELQDYLISKNIVKTKTKLNYCKTTGRGLATDGMACTMEYSGRTNIKNLYNLMYGNLSLGCKEKRDKFLNIICASKEKSLEDTSLIAGTPEMVISSEA